MNIDYITVFIFSYVLGSIPFGLLITKIFLKKDVRNIGSGNIGATNVLRTGKKSLAILTLLLDVFKGYISVYLTLQYFNELIYFSALVCFIGHIFPVWIRFKGGKGVAVYLGIILAISYKLAVVFIFSWLLILFIFKYSSLSSILSAFLVFLFSFILNNSSLNICLFVILIIILFTHKENILRLKDKTENKIKI